MQLYRLVIIKIYLHVFTDKSFMNKDDSCPTEMNAGVFDANKVETSAQGMSELKINKHSF